MGVAGVFLAMNPVPRRAFDMLLPFAHGLSLLLQVGGWTGLAGCFWREGMNEEWMGLVDENLASHSRLYSGLYVLGTFCGARSTGSSMIENCSATAG
ncbi:hypothetical protein F4810DRAFT_663042 [Camillea tinctor]|nr:hypothetical protein F4810DRAFT_663042 [Camillea tinctor]